MTTTALDKAVAAIPGANLTRDRSGRYYTVTVDTPVGSRWVANGCHVYTDATAHGPTSWLAAVEATVLNAVRLGLEPCTDTDCDTCHPET